MPDDDPAPKALACSGLWLPDRDETWLHFVDGPPVSALIIQYLPVPDLVCRAGRRWWPDHAGPDLGQCRLACQPLGA